MRTTASLHTSGGSSATAAGAAMVYQRGKKFLRDKRKAIGNNFPSNPNDESGRRKFIFFQNGILPSPCKDKSSNNFLMETTPSPAKHSGYCGSSELVFVNEGFGGSKILFNGKGSGGKNPKTDGNPGRNLLMENVTILKRGENIEKVVAGRNSDDEEIGRGETRYAVGNWQGGSRVAINSRVSMNYGVPVSSVDDNETNRVSVSVEKKALKQWPHGVRGSADKGHAKKERASTADGVDDNEKNRVSVSVEKKVLKQWPHGVRGSADKGHAKKLRASTAKISQVCPVGSPDSKWDGDGGYVVKQPVATVGDVLIARMGPDPCEVSKDVLGIPSAISSGCRTSEVSSDNGDLLLKFGESVSSGSSVNSVESLPSSPKDLMFDNIGSLNPELSVSSDAAWAGPAYAKSPPPSWLPLPKFFMRHKEKPKNVVEHNVLRGGGNQIFAASGSAIQESKIELALPVELCNVNMNGRDGVDESNRKFTLPVGGCNLNADGQGEVDAFATSNLRRLLHLE